MKKLLTAIFLLLITIGIMLFFTGCNSTNNKVDTSDLKTDYLESENGEKIEFFVPENFEEVDFINKSQKWKGYKKDSASVDLQIINNEKADALMSLENYKETEYTVNNKKFIKLYLESDGKEYSRLYLYKIDDESYYSVSDFRNSLTDKEIDTFLTIK